jgi:hypothetical protein
MKTREEYGSVLVRRIGLERQNDSLVKSFLGELNGKNIILHKACDEMQKEIVALSKKYL